MQQSTMDSAMIQGNSNDIVYFNTSKDFHGPSADNYIFLAPFRLDPNRSDVMYLADGKTLWSSVPDSDMRAWQELKSTTYTVDNSIISAITVATVPKHRLLYGTSLGRLFLLAHADNTSSKPNDITGL